MNTKLDALIKAIEKADNRLIGLEALPSSEAEAITAEMRDTMQRDRVEEAQSKLIRAPDVANKESP